MSDEAGAPRDESSRVGGRPVGRPRLLDEQDLQVLIEVTLAEPHATIRRLQQRMEEQCGKRPSRGTVRAALALLELRKAPPRRQPSTRRSQGAASPPRAARYQARHRREPSRNPRRYPSDLTDREW